MLSPYQSRTWAFYLSALSDTTVVSFVIVCFSIVVVANIVRCGIVVVVVGLLVVVVIMLVADFVDGVSVVGIAVCCVVVLLWLRPTMSLMLLASLCVVGAAGMSRSAAAAS